MLLIVILLILAYACFVALVCITCRKLSAATKIAYPLTESPAAIVQDCTHEHELQQLAVSENH